METTIKKIIMITIMAALCLVPAFSREFYLGGSAGFAARINAWQNSGVEGTEVYRYAPLRIDSLFLADSIPFGLSFNAGADLWVANEHMSSVVPLIAGDLGLYYRMNAMDELKVLFGVNLALSGLPKANKGADMFFVNVGAALKVIMDVTPHFAVGFDYKAGYDVYVLYGKNEKKLNEFSQLFAFGMMYRF